MGIGMQSDNNEKGKLYITNTQKLYDEKFRKYQVERKEGDRGHNQSFIQ